MTTTSWPRIAVKVVGGRVGRVLAAFAAAGVVAGAVSGSALAAHDGFPHSPDASRGFELVSPPYKLSGNGVGQPGAGPAAEAAGQVGSAAYVGERFPVGAHYGAILLDAESATASDWAFAKRVSDEAGWLSHSPVTRAFQGAEYYRMLHMQDAAPDYSTIVWVGNAGDLPFFEQAAAMGNTNNDSSLISDWGNPPQSPTRWEPIGPLEAFQRFDADSAATIFQVPAISADGSHVAVSGAVRGLAGAGDPTLDTIGDGTHVAWVDDISGGLSDSWPGAGVRTPAAICTGADGGPGLARTRLPARNVDGSLGEVACEAPRVAPRRDWRLVSDYGSAITWSNTSSEFIATSNTNVVSRDGSRVFFMAPDPARPNPGSSGCVDSGVATKCPTQLYVRQKNVDGEFVTRWLSRPDPGLLDDPGQAALLGAAYFEGASADGSRVFFRTASPLTADDPNGAGQTPANPSPGLQRSETSWDLYMFELAPGPDGDPATADGDPTGSGSRLTRVTAGPSGAADCSTRPDNTNSAALRFSSQDGRLVYFSCAAPLGGVADRATGTAAGVQGGTPSTTDQTNVYLYDAREPVQADRYTFVARIPRAVGGNQSTRDPLTRCASAGGLRGWSVLHAPASYGLEGGGKNCWRGTDDGSFATFWTLGRLTGDDPHPVGVGASADIYAFDADSDELVRISAPQGPVDETYPCAPSTVGVVCYADPGMHFGSRNPGAANPLLNVVSDPGVSGERTVFFESAARLADGDQNSVFDVYRWREGVLSLVSSGASGSDGTTYKGNSADGKNVYLATRDRLTWQDADPVLDVYTARVGSQGIPRPVEPPVCAVLAGVCHGPGAAAVSVPVMGTGAPVAGGNATPGVRGRISVKRLGRRARRRAARTGVIGLRVRVSRPGVLRLGARARIGRRLVKVAGVRKRIAKAGATTVKLRLNRRARRVLGQGRRLRVRIRVAQSGALSRTATVNLERGNR